ncbi:nucleotide disphospho-sugar-binding domain-containing protein [Rugamonas apoptosis]|uniref:Glycosyltransferase family 1 protein n=1 Tax=Rugamonas apoptosis TaxID=2758570 RepID=A0A7W2FDD7_9BURK|nr:glycosyltransferase [Rugamonas apoptosis]MBA5689618.1 glycosyltransferase family 1 protein [Rugamonas apoptosis]
MPPTLATHRPATGPLIIVASSGTGGDIRPFVLLAQGLRARGHRVRMLVPAFHEKTVLASGLDYQMFGQAAQFQATLDNPDLWDERKGFGVAWQAGVPHLQVLHDMVAALPPDDDCVLLCHPILAPLGAIARAARPGLRVVSAYLAPSNLCSLRDLQMLGSMSIPRWTPLFWRRLLWQVANRVSIDPATLPSLNAGRALRGLPPVTGFLEHMVRAPDAAINLFPSWFAPRQTDWPSHLTGGDFPRTDHGATPPVSPLPPSSLLPPLSPLAPVLEQFLAAGPAPIGFTPGTGHQHAAGYFSMALDALGRLGRRGLFITPHRAQVPDSLPPHVMWVAEAPFNALLPRLAALVHHGGIGTMAEAFRAGVPQLVVPSAFDQFDNAARARQLGVARVILSRRLSARRLHHGLRELLASPDVARACASIAKQATSGPGQPWLITQVETALGVVAPLAAPSHPEPQPQLD